MATWFLVILVFFLLRAYWRSRGEIDALRQDLVRLEGRVDRLFRRVETEASELEDKPAAAPEPEPEPEPAPEPAPERQSAPPVPPATPAPTRAPVLPSADDPVDRAVAWVKERLQGVGWTVIVGVIVLFFGMAFLVKYAIDRDLVSVQLRLAAAAVAGIGMVVFGYRNRNERPLFGLSLQGGGMGVLYLTVFAAFRIYDLVPAGVAFFLLVGFVGASAALALVQRSRVLMTLASTGGFLAPILTSTGSGNHVALFSYYLVLNAGILAVAWFRAWRLLNLVGFGFTFAVATLWGTLRYEPHLFASTEPFLLAFFAMYVAVAVLFALRQPPDLKGLVDGTLVFGVPLAVSALQAALVHDFEYGLAWSAFGFGVFYLALSRFVAVRGGEALTALSESFLATGVVFATLAVPFAFDNVAASALWALEGAAILWIGFRQDRLGVRLFASFLQLGAGFLFLASATELARSAVVNGTFLGAVIVALAGLTSSYLYWVFRRRLVEVETALPVVFLFWGLLWWLGASLREIGRFAPNEDVLGWVLFVLAATAAAAAAAGKQLAWPLLARVALGLVPASALVFLASAIDQSHPFQALTGPGWLVAAVSHALVLWLQRDRDRRLWHAGGLWLGALLASWEASYQVGQWMTEPATWSLASVGATLALILLGVTRFVKSEAYLTLGAMPLVLLALAWLLFANVASPGDPSPLPYVPVLNPLDVAAALVLLAAAGAFRSARAWLDGLGVKKAETIWLSAGAAYYWLHGVLVRTIHHWVDVPFEADAIFDSTIVQTSVAVLWAVTGLLAMVAGTRRGQRPLWVVGASLMAAVVAKLFLVDLSHAETIARIVSFIAVGSLLLAVGYLSPAPPSAGRKAS